MSIFLITFILNHLKPHLSIFRKCLLFLEPNARVSIVSILQCSDYQHHIILIFFANDEAFQLAKWLLRKSRPISPDFIGAKLLIFRKSHKHFAVFLHLRRINSIPFCQNLLKLLIMRLLRKSHFSQMILPLLDLFQ